MQRHFLLVGFGRQENYISSILKTGATVSVLVTKKHKNLFGAGIYRVIEVTDIYNWPEIKQVVTQLDQELAIDAVLTRHEMYLSVVGSLNQYLDLPGIDYATARKFANKYLMKQAWQVRAVPCAAGVVADDLTTPEVAEFLKQHAFPLMLKKTSAAHSKYVLRVDSQADLLAKWSMLQAEALDFAVAKPLINYPFATKEPQLILEEMMYGRELTVDTFVTSHGFSHTEICEYIMAADLGVDDTYLPVRSMPTVLAAADRQLVLQTVEQALTALGARNCVCHTEVFFDQSSQQCRLIESTPRGGGNRGLMTKLSSRYDYNQAVFQATAGKKVAKQAPPSQFVSVVEYFAEIEGRVLATDLSFLTKVAELSRLKINCRLGDMVKPAQVGGKPLLSFFITTRTGAANQTLARQLFAQLRSAIKIGFVAPALALLGDTDLVVPTTV